MKIFIIKRMDFDVEILKLPDQNTTAIKVTTNNGKTFSTIIKNRILKTKQKPWFHIL